MQRPERGCYSERGAWKATHQTRWSFMCWVLGIVWLRLWWVEKSTGRGISVADSEKQSDK